MSKITLKSVQESLDALKKAATEYASIIRNPKRILSSTTDGTQKTADGAKGQAMVSINDLIATTRTAEQTGYVTVLRVTNGGKSLETDSGQWSFPSAGVYEVEIVWFPQNVNEIREPSGFYL